MYIPFVFCGIVEHSDKKTSKILEFNQFLKFIKMLCMIYVDLESLIKEIDEWKKDPKKFTVIKTIEKIECIQLDGIENKHNVYK